VESQRRTALGEDVPRMKVRVASWVSAVALSVLIEKSEAIVPEISLAPAERVLTTISSK